MGDLDKCAHLQRSSSVIPCPAVGIIRARAIRRSCDYSAHSAEPESSAAYSFGLKHSHTATSANPTIPHASTSKVFTLPPCVDSAVVGPFA